jgi:predicted SAM-dependent methyltransferase
MMIKKSLRQFVNMSESLFDLYVKVLNKFFKIKGINLGSGKYWRKIGWQGIDQVNGQMIDKNTRFPFDNNSINYVYTEHFIEHIDDKTWDNLLKESSRVLVEGGKIRIITPDFEKLLFKYREGDENFFKNIIGFNGRPEWKKNGVKSSLENILGHWFANYDSKDTNEDDDFYRGPPMGIENDIKVQAHSLSVSEFSKWIVSKIPIERYKQPYGHINWFTYDKIYSALKDKGFVNISKSSCSQSKYSAFLDSKFDRKIRAHYSLYIEAEKITSSKN